MITINLLPSEYRALEFELAPPLKKLSGILTGVFLVAGIFLTFRNYNLQNEVLSWENAWISYKTQAREADLLLQEINKELLPKKQYFDQMGIGGFGFDEILDLISESLVGGLWLSHLKIDRGTEHLVIEIEGKGIPYRNRPVMATIGEYIANLKKGLENLVSQEGAVSPQGVPSRPFPNQPTGYAGAAPSSPQTVFDVETLTEREQIEKFDAIKFNGIFKRKF